MVTIPLILLGAFLGAWAGADRTSKSWRRLGIPALLAGFGYFVRGWLGLFPLLLVLPLSIGYGRADGFDDNPSFLGRMVVWIKSETLQDTIIRGIVGAIVGLCWIPFAVVSGKWITFSLTVMGMIAVYILFGAVIDKEGDLKVFGKEILMEDVWIYGFLMYLSILNILGI